jgi:hypothetical protein
MPTAQLTFKLPEEREEYETTMRAGKYHSAIWDLGQHLRAILKYGDEGMSDEKRAIYEEIRKKFYDILEENEVIGDF